MAKHDANWTPETDDTPPSAPKTRDELVQENRAAEDARPDSDDRAPSGVPLNPRTEPVRTHAVHAAETGQHDVRVGPGDAGAADRPDRAPVPPQRRSDSWGRALGIVGVVAVIAIVVLILV